MAVPKPWAGMDPNSAHQLWSHWTYRVHEGGRHLPAGEVLDNARRWARLGFGSVGQIRHRVGWETDTLPQGRPFRERVHTIELQVEGVPAHDPAYVAAVHQGFAEFVAKGWGPTGFAEVTVAILAGDLQEGKPRAQLVVMPSIRLP